MARTPSTRQEVIHRLTAMNGVERLRWVLNWINGSTLLGLVAARLGRCEIRPAGHGLIFAFGYSLRLPLASAFTLGNVVLFRLGPEHVAHVPRLVSHEARHSTQYAWCLGVPFLPAYFLAAGISWLLTGDPASRNPFERNAGLADGGYAERPVRPGLRRLGNRTHRN